MKVVGGMLLAICLLGVVFLLNVLVKKPSTKDYAVDVASLQICVTSGKNTENIKAWKPENTDDTYYFFLPSCVRENANITFGNLKGTDSVLLDGVAYRADTLLNDIEYGREYEAAFSGQENEKDKVVFMSSANLRTVYIKTESGSVENIHSDKNVKEVAYLVIQDATGNVEYDHQIDYIKTRGNSSFYNMDKKSYQIKLFQRSKIAGMKKADKWILLADMIDPSLIRNQFVYHFANKYTEVPASDGIFVDLYVNGDYLGNYYLCEKVEVGKNRLDIRDLKKENKEENSGVTVTEQYISEDGSVRAVKGLKSPDNITGGYLVQLISDEKYDTIPSGFYTNLGKAYEIVSPSNATIEEAEYIQNVFNEMERAITESEETELTKYIDLESWGQKYLIEEFFHDPDAPLASEFFYKKADDPLIYAGPIWDFDRALGSYGIDRNYMDLAETTGYYSVYANELMKKDIFYDYVKEKFYELICPYMENEAEQDVEEWITEIQNSAEMNHIRWEGQFAGYYDTTKASAEYIITFLNKRLQFFRDTFEGTAQYHSVVFRDYDGMVVSEEIVRHGEYIQNVPDVSSYVAIFNGWVSTKTGYRLDRNYPVLEDADYQSQWIDASLVMQNGLAMAEMDVQDVDIDALEALVEYIKLQQEETDEK